uniref:Variant surface glycoprotein 1125.4185 n=1 Tax=Trypanosoma brucei TaxID=5691 RepID=A0A1J0RAG8_9TRYP|nr:variant surface glycoprotein 1125.4185 [Trypanosoma brucei]
MGHKTLAFSGQAIRLTSFLLFLAAVSLIFHRVAAEQTQANTAATACDETKFNDKLVTKLDSQLQTAQQRVGELQAEERLYSLAACKAEGTSDAAAYGLLTAIAAKRATALQAAVQANKDKLLTVIKKLKRRNAALKALQLMSPIGSATFSEAAVGSGTVGLGAGNTGTCEVTAKAESATKDTCQTQTSKDAQLATDADNLTTLKSFKAIPDSAFKFNDIKIKITAIEHGTKVDSVATGSDACAQSARSTPAAKGSASQGMAVVSIHRKAEATQTKTVAMNDDGADGAKCTADADVDTNFIITTKDLAHALCDARQAIIDTPRKVSEEKIKMLITQADTKNIAVLLKNGKQAQTPSAEAQTAAAKDILGEDDQTVQQRFGALLAQWKLDIKPGAVDGGSPITTLPNVIDYASALAFCLGKTRGKGAASAANPTQTVTSTVERKATASDKCDQIKCEWKEINGKEECKPKVGEGAVKAENDGKATNTTTRNTIVINKAPLLLR